MFPAPPSSTTTSPSATRPAASAPATWSAPPATTGTPRSCGSSAQATVPSDRAGRRHRAQPAGVHLGGLADVGRPLARAEVVQAALQRPVRLHRCRAGGQPPHHEVVGPADGRGLPQHLRLVLAQPGHLRADRLLGDRRPGAVQHVRAGQRVPLRGHLGGGPGVVLLYRRAQRPARLVEADEGGHHAGHADAAHVPAARARGRQHGRNQFTCITPPRGRVFLRPAGLRRGQRHRAGFPGDDSPARIDEHAFGRRRADVQPQQQLAHCLLAGATPARPPPGIA